MNERYEIFPEWNADQKYYRIYDKETDSLLGLFISLEEATRECTRLAQGPRDRDAAPRGAAPTSKTSGDHEHQQHD
jgi:hypothetical protein